MSPANASRSPTWVRFGPIVAPTSSGAVGDRVARRAAPLAPRCLRELGDRWRRRAASSARRPTRRSRTRSARSRAAACWRARGRSTRRTDRGTCPGGSASIVSVFGWPGTTSFLPASSGHPERVDHVVARERQQDRPVDRDVHLVGRVEPGALVGVLVLPEPLPGRRPSTWTTLGPFGILARLKIVATVGTAITARIRNGMIVQLTSSTMLPWVCTGLRSSPGRSRNRIATKIVIDDHAGADRRPRPRRTASSG